MSLICVSALFVMWIAPTTSLINESGIQSSYHKMKFDTIVSGQIKSASDSWKLILCSANCIKSKCSCKGILFNKNQPKSMRCKHILYGTAQNNLSSYAGYMLYSYKVHMQTKCTTLQIGNVTLQNWQSSCPHLYFSLDDMEEGKALGIEPGNIQIVSDAILGRALYNPTTEWHIKSYYTLGKYPVATNCFHFPETCPHGMTIAFWLNICGTTNNYQGFITSMKAVGAGFSIVWSEQSWSGFTFRVRRASDMIQEDIKIPHSVFHSEYGGFNTWNHFVMTYFYNGNENIIGIYVNGNECTNVARYVEYRALTVDTEGCGVLDLGRYYTDNDDIAMGNMKIDEVIIWEDQISAQDIHNLYNAY